MEAQIIGSIGAILNIAGAIIVLFFAHPQPEFEVIGVLALEDANMAEDGRTYGEHRANAKVAQDRYKRLAFFGASVLVLGFVFQLVAIWV